MAAIAPMTQPGRAGLDAIVADPGRALLAFDFDGTLSPIVEDPTRAYALDGIVDALAALAGRVGQVAVVTGRPAQVAVDLARLDDAPGLEHLVVLGHYGLERWTSATGEVTTAAQPPALAQARAEIDGVIEAAGVHDADIEDKGLALAVHVRRSADPREAYRKVEGPLIALAERVGLAAEPGRLVVELRPRGMDKGKALLALAAEVDARALMFTGDDLGDLAAFDAVTSWRATGGAGLLVCSGSSEVTELAERADLVVDGPSGVLALLRDLTTLLA